ncbi:MAG: CBS domain-containing protein [Planctomycetota bacterium]
MTAGRVCVRSVHVAAPDESVREAARRMREADVGTLIVLDEKRNPVGVLTDRDVTLRCVAEARDPDETPVSAVMTAPLLCVAESAPIEEALRRMAGIGARRLGVTDESGQLAGVLSVDDVVDLLVEEAETIGRLLQRRHPPLEA